MKISKKTSEKILTIGPEYHNHRGGIGAVIDIYNKYFDGFNFIPTYKEGSALFKTYVFLIGLLKISYTLLRNRNIEIVHIHGSSRASFYRKFICFIISKYLFKKKVIYHIHDGTYHLFYAHSKTVTRKMIRMFVNHVDCLICLSESWKLFYEENFKAKSIVILPNIIDYPVIKERKKDTRKIHFLFLGLISNNKGIFDLIEVIKNNIDAFDNKIELIIGGNGEVDRLQKLIEEYRIGHIVKFVGWVQNEIKVQYLHNIDVYILPSYNEGLPISILEAMSYRKPIISTNVGGIPEIVKNNENGFLISPGNLGQIEKSIKYFIKNPHDIEKFGHISEKMVEKYLPESVILHLENVYYQIYQILNHTKNETK